MANTSLLFFKSCIFLIGQLFATVAIASVSLCFFAFPFKVRYHLITSWSHFIIWWAKIICGIQYNVQGKENLPHRNAIILCKHQSAWETLFLQTLLPPQTWVLKKELLWIPFFGWALALLNPIAIDRKRASSLKQLLAQGKDRLQRGLWVIIFPEGTRVALGQVGNYSRSGVLLAKESGYPIVPIAHNAGVFWPKNSFIKKPGTIEVRIGPVFQVRDDAIGSLHNQVQTWIEEQMTKLPSSSSAQ